MAEYGTELLTSSPAKACKLLNSKAKGFSVYKRRIDSVKIQYYARIKRICHEPCLSADLGDVVVPCSCVRKDGGTCGCQLKCSKDHQFVNKVNLPSGGAISSYGCGGGSDADRQHVPSNGNEHANTESDHSDGRIMIGDSNHESLKGYSVVDQLYGYDYMQKNSQTSESDIVSTDIGLDLVNVNDTGAIGSKALPSIDPDGINHNQLSWNSAGGLLEPGSLNAARGRWCPEAPVIPSWSKLLGVSSPELTDVHSIDQETLILSDGKVEMKSNDALAFCSNLDGGMPDSGSGNATVSAGGFMHSSLKGFCKEEDLDLFSGGHVLQSTLDTNQESVGDSQAKVFLKGGSGDVQCILNTEDSEIPFDDHIPTDQSSLLTTSTLKQDSQHDMCLVPTKPMIMENVIPSPPSPPPPIKLEPSIEEQKECVVGSFHPAMHCDGGSNNANTHTKALHSVDECEGTTCGLFQCECCDNLQNLTLDKSIEVPNQMNCKFLAEKPKKDCETAIQSHTMSHALLDTEFHNPIAPMSTSAQAEESDSENCVPDYFDIEALILDQDLIPWDQESDVIQPEVSRFCSPGGRKDLMILEKGACSSMNRSIMSKGAFAIIYGQHLIYYIRDTEVTLGRETVDVHVDIDLGKEGNANKISRRQAVIKMDSGGSFYIKNIGKASIFVNSKEVPCRKRILLTSDSLIEIRNMKFIFHVNHTVVRQHIVRGMKESTQGNNTTFDWNPNA